MYGYVIVSAFGRVRAGPPPLSEDRHATTSPAPNVLGASSPLNAMI
jgi:hypothetical protein